MFLDLMHNAEIVQDYRWLQIVQTSWNYWYKHLVLSDEIKNNTRKITAEHTSLDGINYNKPGQHSANCKKYPLPVNILLIVKSTPYPCFWSGTTSITKSSWKSLITFSAIHSYIWTGLIHPTVKTCNNLIR